MSETRLEGPQLIEPVVHGDERGFSLESFRADLLADAGIELNLCAGQPQPLTPRGRARDSLPATVSVEPGPA